MGIELHLEEVLKKKKMTSKELAKKIGITEANLSILRSGKAKGVRFETLNRICFYLNCQVGDLLQFDGELEESHETENGDRKESKESGTKNGKNEKSVDD